MGGEFLGLVGLSDLCRRKKHVLAFLKKMPHLECFGQSRIVGVETASGERALLSGSGQFLKALLLPSASLLLVPSFCMASEDQGSSPS